jgi:hypothetical protein
LDNSLSKKFLLISGGSAVDINIEKKEGIDKNTRFEMIFK